MGKIEDTHSMEPSLWKGVYTIEFEIGNENTQVKKDDLKIIVSHRGGGETTDTFIIDLAVCVLADYVKVGPSRGERVDKYNRLMEIGEELGL